MPVVHFWVFHRCSEQSLLLPTSSCFSLLLCLRVFFFLQYNKSLLSQCAGQPKPESLGIEKPRGHPQLMREERWCVTRLTSFSPWASREQVASSRKNVQEMCGEGWS